MSSRPSVAGYSPAAKSSGPPPADEPYTTSVSRNTLPSAPQAHLWEQGSEPFQPVRYREASATTVRPRCASTNPHQTLVSAPYYSDPGGGFAQAQVPSGQPIGPPAPALKDTVYPGRSNAKSMPASSPVSSTGSGTFKMYETQPSESGSSPAVSRALPELPGISGRRPTDKSDSKAYHSIPGSNSKSQVSTNLEPIGDGQKRRPPSELTRDQMGPGLPLCAMCQSPSQTNKMMLLPECLHPICTSCIRLNVFFNAELFGGITTGRLECRLCDFESRKSLPAGGIGKSYAVPVVNPHIVLLMEATSAMTQQAQRVASRSKKMKVETDPTFALDFGRLSSYVTTARGRTPAQAVVYSERGNSIPRSDTIWTLLDQSYDESPSSSQVSSASFASETSETCWKARTQLEESASVLVALGMDAAASVVSRSSSAGPAGRPALLIMILESHAMLTVVEDILKLTEKPYGARLPNPSDSNGGRTVPGAEWKIEVWAFTQGLGGDGQRIMDLKDRYPMRFSVKYMDKDVMKIGQTNYSLSATRVSSATFPKAVVIPGAGSQLNYFGDGERGRPGTELLGDTIADATSLPFQMRLMEDTEDVAVVFKVDVNIEEVVLSLNRQLDRLGATGRVIPLRTYDMMETDRSSRHRREPKKNDPSDGETLQKSRREPLGREGSESNESVGRTTSDAARSLGRPSPQLSTEYCYFGKKCKNGMFCIYLHSEEDHRYFESRPSGRGNPTRKTTLCHFFRQRKCSKLPKDCDFAHGPEDAFCRKCRESGHLEEDCRATTIAPQLLPHGEPAWSGGYADSSNPGGT